MPPINLNLAKKMRIVIGLIGVIASFLLIMYRVKINHFIGGIKWAEDKIGPGGTYTLMILIAIGGFIFSLMYMTNSFDLFFSHFGARFFDSSQ